MLLYLGVTDQWSMIKQTILCIKNGPINKHLVNE